MVMAGLRGAHRHASSTTCTESATWTPNNTTATCTRGTSTRGWRAIITLTRPVWQLVWGEMKSCGKQSHRQSRAYELLLSLLLSPADAPAETRPKPQSSQQHHHHVHTGANSTAFISTTLPAIPHPAFLFTRICK